MPGTPWHLLIGRRIRMTLSSTRKGLLLPRRITSRAQRAIEDFSVTPVILPVYRDVNDTFGEINHVNVAGRVYFLFYDTDIDLLSL